MTASLGEKRIAWSHVKKWHLNIDMKLCTKKNVVNFRLFRIFFHRKWKNGTHIYGHMEYTWNRMHMLLLMVAVASAAYEWHQSELLTEFFSVKILSLQSMMMTICTATCSTCFWHNKVCYANPLNEYICATCASVWIFFVEQIVIFP